MTLETLRHKPFDTLQILVKGSKRDQSHTGSGVYIKTSASILRLKYRNSNSCSVYRSKVIAIDNLVEPNFKSNLALTDSHSSIQHSSNWKK
ncbi:hypothetical protein TNIN_189571 [Trichonephila inaurata madagascariensis]|uniref:Uncharacterized protein n=1 Tax=Trichonephila inaurata madagascariensis TaxID=2747483 RepID=A0A8X7CFR3_9ARAC|nr:hypothetical protein TNIN_189571 [Trichonephila inaurata madagascariensis]